MIDATHAKFLVQTMNRAYPVGTVVDVEKDDGSLFLTKVRNEFVLLGGHTPVGWFEGIRGCYLATRVREVKEPDEGE